VFTVQRFKNAMRLASTVTAFLFLLSSILNLGKKIPLGFGELSFTNPSTSIAETEIVIAILLLFSVIIPRLYVFGAAYILATVGIAFGLASVGVQGLARSLHLLMIPFVVAGFLLLGAEAYYSYESRVDKSPKAINRELILILQFFNAGLVTLGGIAYTATGSRPLGPILGSIHLVVGLSGFYTGYAFLKSKSSARNLLVYVNLVTILYSTFSESMAQIFALLTPGINDSLIGTIIAIIISGFIICMVLLRPLTVSPKTIETNPALN
jgi:hypothetical protein